MKILYVIDWPNLYGSELHLLDIVKFQHRINSVMVLCFREGPLVDILKSLGVEVVILQLTSWRMTFQKSKSFLKIINEYEPDIVHAHQPKATLYTSIICCFHRVCCVSTIHVMPMVSASNYKGVQKILVFFFHELVLFLTNLFSIHNIYVSNQSSQMFPLFKNKRTVIYNWISPRLRNQFNSAPKELSKNLKFLCMSSLVASKGIVEAIQLFSKIHKYNEDTELIIIGDSKDLDYKKEIAYVINDLSLNDVVKMKGYKENIGYYLMNSDFFISLTKGETFGLTLVEAMYWGCPIICSNLPILHEVVAPGNFFINIENVDMGRLIEFISNKRELNILSYNNKKWVENRYSYEKQQNKLSDLYIKVWRAFNK